MVVLSSATSAISFAARASSFVFLASPISFEAALRRACACSEARIAARRVSSIASSDADKGFRPRRARPASKACGLSRIDLMSCMAEVLGLVATLQILDLHSCKWLLPLARLSSSAKADDPVFQSDSPRGRGVLDSPPARGRQRGYGPTPLDWPASIRRCL